VLKAGDTMTGALVVPLASAATPSLTFTSDLNTGIYSPGADQLAISTNGTGRLTIDASGNVNIDSNTLYVDATNDRVGIGTTSPGSPLHVVGALGVEVTNSQANNSAKSGRYTTTHYTTTEEPICIAVGLGNESESQVRIGGGTSNLNAATSVEFYTAANTTTVTGTERARIDSSGRLLVGTSTSSSSTRFIVEGNAIDGVESFVDMQYGGTNPASGTGIGRVRFKDRTADQFYAEIGAFADASTAAGDKPGRLVFSTTADGASSPTERMRITSVGTLLLNTGGVAPSSTVNGVQLRNTSSGSNMFSSGTATTAWNQLVLTNGNGTVGTIQTSASSTSYNTSSDYRLKENIAPLTGAIDRLNDLQVHRFNFIADPDTTVDGFLAHEAQEVVPECVTGTKDEVDEDGNPVYQGIDQSKLVPLLTAALQEAISRIETLEAKVEALEAS
jgi:hypothetical protein